jgi:integrase
MNDRRAARGIEVRHGRTCPARRGGRCAQRGCGFRAEVWSAREGKRIRRTFATLAAAKAWRADAAGEIRRGRLRAGRALTLRSAAAEWIAAAEAGAIVNRSGDPYKPSVLRSYREALDTRVLPELGSMRLNELDRPQLQRFVGRLSAGGLRPSTVRNALMPLRAIYRHALAHGEVSANPTVGLQLPAVRGKWDTIVSPATAARLIAALEERDRALWATALYAGLRRGELMALRWRDLDFERGLIRVERSWDRLAGPVAPKSRSGRRVVPIPQALREQFERHRELHADRRADDLVFGRLPTAPFDPSTVHDRARRAWKTADLEGLTLHDCRHTYASMMIAAGANVKALSTYLGHASITITMDRYGHLMPGNEQEAAELFDRYLDGGAPPSSASTATRNAGR